MLEGHPLEAHLLVVFLPQILYPYTRRLNRLQESI